MTYAYAVVADVHRHLEGEGHLPVLGGGRPLGALPLQPRPPRRHPHPRAPALLAHNHHHHPAQLLHDDHALERAD